MEGEATLRLPDPSVEHHNAAEQQTAQQLSLVVVRPALQAELADRLAEQVPAERLEGLLVRRVDQQVGQIGQRSRGTAGSGPSTVDDWPACTIRSSVHEPEPLQRRQGVTVDGRDELPEALDRIPRPVEAHLARNGGQHRL